MGAGMSEFEMAGATHVEEDLSSICFSRGPRFKHAMQDSILCGVGDLTAGQHNRKQLHDSLDKWIDDNLKENT
jgi:hypothetical protein